MKKSVAVSVNEEKLSAIEMYLEQKNTTLAAELDKYCNPDADTADGKADRNSSGLGKFHGKGL